LILEELVRDNYLFVALLNNDTLVDPSWLEAMVGLAKFRNLDMVSAKLINYFDRQQIDNLGHQMLNTGEIVPIAHKAAIDDYSMSFMNLGPCAGAALYSVEMLKKIGLFDPFFSTGYEDAELGLRGIVVGYQSALAPDALVFHKMGQSVSKVFDDQYAIMIQSAIWYTYFKLMPAGVIIISMPFILVKNFLLSLVNILFIRAKYLKIQWMAIWFTVTKNRKFIVKSRRKFYNSGKTISTWQILGKQRFFLWFDIIRFYHIFIQQKKSALDKYGGE
jgi:GT2 family glycosyltransferase